MNRRDFLKRSAVAGVSVTAATIAIKNFKPKGAEVGGLLDKQYDTIDHMLKIDPNIKRFHMYNTAFCKMELHIAQINPLPADSLLVMKLNQMMASMQEGEGPPGEQEGGPQDGQVRPGFTQLDNALSAGAGAVESFTSTGRTLSGDSGSAIALKNGKYLPLSLYRQQDFSSESGMHQKHIFKSKKDASYAVKKAAKLYGADLVGIAPFDERWLYQTEVYMPLDFQSGETIQELMNIKRPVNLGFTPKSVVVLAYEMDYEAYKTQPSGIGEAATSVGYSRMAENSIKVKSFLKALGYQAHHAGNDTGLSVPVAIQAGLGEGSRMGLLITKKYGPRIRLAKVYTDLELEYDKPISFGVKEFCEICQKCSDACPSGCLSKVAKTSSTENIPHNNSNMIGVDKWFNDAEKCFAFWAENGSECGLCISVCPYNKIDEWHHKVAQVSAEIPGLRNVARHLDEIFGYQKGIIDKKDLTEYWYKTI